MGLGSLLAGAAGGVANMGFDLWKHEDAQKHNQAQFDQSNNLANRNLDWQKEFANQRYQKTVTDMTQAGLNPALMFGSGGPGGSAGGSPLASPSSGSSSTIGTGSSGVSSRDVREAAKLKNEQAILEQNLKNLKAQKTKSYTSAEKDIKESKVLDSRKKIALEEEKQAKILTDMTRTQARVYKSHNILYRDPKLRKAAGYAKGVIDLFRGGAQGASAFRNSLKK